MSALSYRQRRAEIETYFDRTAVEAWSRLTSNAPVGRIRRTVRVGREQMRRRLLSWLPEDLSGCRVLDAGCGTGALAVEAARRGARVVAVDLSPRLIEIARERLPDDVGSGRLELRVGDMCDPDLGMFDFVVAMDSLIHYGAPDAVAALARLSGRVRRSILLTFAPRTPLLGLMHSVGRLFPRGDRAPAIEPVVAEQLSRLVSDAAELQAWTPGRSERISSGFYTSQAFELIRR
jgi:magnesium-protoporphyrin O-methyltransferase